MVFRMFTVDSFVITYYHVCLLKRSLYKCRKSAPKTLVFFLRSLCLHQGSSGKRAWWLWNVEGVQELNGDKICRMLNGGKEETMVHQSRYAGYVLRSSLVALVLLELNLTGTFRDLRGCNASIGGAP